MRGWPEHDFCRMKAEHPCAFSWILLLVYAQVDEFISMHMQTLLYVNEYYFITILEISYLVPQKNRKSIYAFQNFIFTTYGKTELLLFDGCFPYIILLRQASIGAGLAWNPHKPGSSTCICYGHSTLFCVYTTLPVIHLATSSASHLYSPIWKKNALTSLIPLNNQIQVYTKGICITERPVWIEWFGLQIQKGKIVL